MTTLASVVTVAEICNSVGGGVFFDMPPRCQCRVWVGLGLLIDIRIATSHRPFPLYFKLGHVVHLSRCDKLAAWPLWACSMHHALPVNLSCSLSLTPHHNARVNHRRHC